MADEKGKIKRPYNYILPGYELVFLLHFFCCSIICFNKQWKKMCMVKKVYFLCFRLSKKHFLYFNFHLNPRPLSNPYCIFVFA